MLERRFGIHPEETARNEVLLDRVEGIIRGSYDMDSYIVNCHLWSIYPRDVADVLSHPQAANDLLRKFSDFPEWRRYQAAVAGASLPFESLEDDVKEKMDVIQDDSNLSIMTYHPSWDLCFRAEDYMKRAISSERIISINGGKMLLKAKGYKTALALQTFGTSKGLFVAGNWYSPMGDLKEEVKKAFDEDVHEMNVTDGQFALLRPLMDGKKGNSTLERSRQYVNGEKPKSYVRKVVGKIRR